MSDHVQDSEHSENWFGHVGSNGPSTFQNIQDVGMLGTHNDHAKDEEKTNGMIFGENF